MNVRTKLWTREEYDRLVAIGGFHPEARVQLVEGGIVEMTPQSAAHATGVLRAQKALEATFSRGYVVRAQLPLALGTLSEPEPDVAVVYGTIDDYRDQHPTTALLVVEIADSTLLFERQDKQRIYAAASVAEYWIVNLLDRCLEAYREPGGSAYGVTQRLEADETIGPLAAPGTRIRISDLLP
jgi:Uma2 family endonuclease